MAGNGKPWLVSSEQEILFQNTVQLAVNTECDTAGNFVVATTMSV